MHNFMARFRRLRKERETSPTNLTQNRATKRAFRNTALKLRNGQTTKEVRHYGRVTTAVGSRTADRRVRMARKAERRNRLRGV